MNKQRNATATEECIHGCPIMSKGSADSKKGRALFFRPGAWRDSLAAPERHDFGLDWLRGLAATAVFLTHLRGGFFVKWSELDSASQNLTNLILFSLSRIGRESVIVFFVLSGYLVGGNALHRAVVGDFSVKRYAIARIARLYPVLLPALCVTAVLDLLPGQSLPTADTLESFLINIFFLNGILGPTFGSNAPLWSLAYEWWYYVAFGAGLAAATSIRTGKTLWLVSSITVMCAAVIVMSGPMLVLFPLWLLGAVARAAPVHRNEAFTAFAGLCLLIAIAASSFLWNVLGDYLVGLATVGFIYGIKDRPPLSAGWFRFGAALAAFSYTLYAFHYPINNVAIAFLHPDRLRVAGIAQWAALVIVGAGIALICYGFYWLFERRSPDVRRWLETKWVAGRLQW